ncbi:G patch domain-containing protein 2 [Parasteatoda tepidariorum]|uniref:G patch domain-containing protein 2 n=1 Tax=Parasteatoda tepidariorum TaxID=114398 RepID=UPI00077F8BB9|nr:G patch domain-containing protein 2 [Parasteatoda tepidariorum]XP_015912658.1 G patch domain-containing protein 2 [Parasteatoda tepidariorum]XP_015912660.1 G patch domain-containing protein 2 [Parasteatoda tepidariorum]XP_015912661.1 G patch domain-containing protein 2 [Parasteatoda tepidariorum]XP_042896980.1 G patch domain-containing protein 2 [Parasteatoda tepidariorum]
MARINPRAKNIPSKNELVVSNEENSPLLNAFTRALSSALDESSERLIRASRPRKNKTWKYQKAKNEKVKKSNCVSKSIKSSAKSDSDSSLDNWIDHQMDVSRKVFSHCTDSDEFNKSFPNFPEWRTCLSIGESDSITESAHRTRIPRRKRKFKRMAIDSPAKNTFIPISRSDVLSPKSKRNRNPKLQKNLKVQVKGNNVSKLPCPRIASKMKRVCPNVSRESSAYGKRKRKVKKFECNFYNPNLHPLTWESADFVIDSSEDCLASRHSSSESECELSTNDESREADDEQSDFFCETGASHNVLKSEEECDDDDEDEDSDDETGLLCHLLEVRFDYIPAFRSMHQRSRKKMYEALKKKVEENGGNVEANQKRLLKAYQSFSYLTEEDLLADVIFQNNHSSNVK